LNTRRFKLFEKRASVKGEVDREICQEVAPLEADGHRNILAGALAIHEGLKANNVLRARLMNAGVDVIAHEAALPLHLFPAGAAIGSPHNAGTSPLWFYLQWLEQKGII
jgi:hypothetical protein